jgi:hypothetical protein
VRAEPRHEHQPDRHRQGAGEVEVACCGDVARAGAHDAQRRDRAEQPDRHVDEQDPAPAQRLGQHAAQQCARRAADRPHRAPQAERPVALQPLGEAGGEDRQRRRSDDRPAEPLRRARGDQRELVLGQTARERGEREQDEAAGEHLAPAEQIGGAAAEQQEAGERERVGVDDPGERRGREAEVVRDRRQRDVHDRHVEDDHELREAADDERQGRSPLVRHAG